MGEKFNTNHMYHLEQKKHGLKKGLPSTSESFKVVRDEMNKTLSIYY